jgi:hypothetical protein
MTEQIGTSPNLTLRGMARRSLDLIDRMYLIAKAAHPITGRGVAADIWRRVQ